MELAVRIRRHAEGLGDDNLKGTVGSETTRRFLQVTRPGE